MTTDLTTAPEHTRTLLNPDLRNSDTSFLDAVEKAATAAVTAHTITGAEAARRAQELIDYATDLISRMPHHRYMAGEHLRSLWPDAPSTAWEAAMDAETARRTAKAARLRSIANIYLDALTLA